MILLRRVKDGRQIYTVIKIVAGGTTTSMQSMHNFMIYMYVGTCLHMHKCKYMYVYIMYMYNVGLYTPIV